MDNNGIISEMQLKQKTSPPASDKLYRKHWRGGFHYQLETLSLLVANIEGPPCCSPSRTTKLRICIFDKKKIFISKLLDQGPSVEVSLSIYEVSLQRIKFRII